MTRYLSTPCTAFIGTRRFASGALIDVALAIKAHDAAAQGSLFIFDDASGAAIDLDLRGTTAEIVTRLTEHGELTELAARTRGDLLGSPVRSRGRPKLGVVAREVTLLPRHWEWNLCVHRTHELVLINPFDNLIRPYIRPTIGKSNAIRKCG